MDDQFEILKKELPDLQKRVSLEEYTTFNIGGPATYFLATSKKEDIVKALTLAKELSIPFFILGGGSNVLISDQGFDGLVVKMNGRNIRLVSDAVIEADAGVDLGALVNFSIENNLQGLEWAGGLPGTFGGAIRGNAGAFGGEMKDTIFEVEAFDKNLNIKKFSNKESGFSYRSSLFKEESWIIISAQVKLQKGDKENLRTIADAHINYRKEKHPLEYPSAGSVFKNVDVKKLLPEFQKLFADKIKQDPFPIVPSAWFIIGAGLTGTKIGQAQISEKHSNYIVNLGGATAKDVMTLISLVKEKVKKMYGVDLEQEVQYLD